MSIYDCLRLFVTIYDRLHNSKERAEIIYVFAKKLTTSGYSENDHEEIIRSGMRGYFNKVEKEKKGGEKINRDGRRNKTIKKVNKVIRKKNWQQPREREEKKEKKINNNNNKNNNKKRKEGEIVQRVEGVVFIPYTPMSELRKRLQDWEDRFSKTQQIPKVRFV